MAKSKSKANKTDKSDKPNKGGQPTKWRPEYNQGIVDFMKTDGEPIYKYFSFEGEVTKEVVGHLPRFLEDYADEIKVNGDTIVEWAKAENVEKYPGFSAAYKKAKNIQLERMVKGMMAGSLIPSATIFTLKNMFRWTDAIKVEQSGNVTVKTIKEKAKSLKDPTLTDAEINRRLIEAAQTGKTESH